MLPPLFLPLAEAWPFEALTSPVSYPNLQGWLFNQLGTAVAYGLPVVFSFAALGFLVRLLLRRR